MLLTLLITILFCAWRIARRFRFFAHILQLEGYKPRQYFDWVSSRFGDVVFRTSHRLAVTWMVLVIFMASLLPESLIPILYLLWAATFASSRRYRRDRPKKPLSYTSRMKRVLSVTSVMALGILIAGGTGGPGLYSWRGATLFLTGFLAVDFLSPFLILASVLILQPVENLIQEGFKRSARSRLRSRDDLDIIAVTGSYGKTSVKFAIRDVLEHRFSVLATPDSYNTPMGVCKVVNNDLSAMHRILVLEMGIRNPGDIEELCQIAVPDIALVTSVGIAHLESMGSVEAIAEEKGSLLRYAKPGGHAVLNADDQRVKDMASQYDGTVWYVSCKGDPDAHIQASGIQYGPEGASFDVLDDTGATMRMQTRLVGEHNVLNVLMAVAVGRIYGLRLRQIAKAVSKIAPVPHRLEVRQEGGITVIDDAFNSNPIGARNAVEILGQMDARKRFIVTPGMIELGDVEYDENREFGKHIAQNADVAILVGEVRTHAIAEGLRDEAFPEEKIQIVQSLFEAKDILNRSLQSGDVVLFENDLPDQFNEG